MPCPKCGAPMETVQAAYGDTLDRCEGRHGLFIPLQSLLSLRRERVAWPGMKTERRLDTGDAAKGRDYSTVVDIDCPRCEVSMRHVTVPDQHHMELEQCGRCKGIWFDAGELTDLKYKTVADWLRDRLNKPGNAVDGELDLLPERH